MDLPEEAEIPPSRPPIGDLFGQLIEDGENFVRAEVQLYRAQATKKALSAGWMIGFFGGVIVLGQAVAVALLVGILMGLTPHVGAWWATAIVVVVTLLVIALLARLGFNQVKKIAKLGDDE